MKQSLTNHIAVVQQFGIFIRFGEIGGKYLFLILTQKQKTLQAKAFPADESSLKTRRVKALYGLHRDDNKIFRFRTPILQKQLSISAIACAYSSVVPLHCFLWQLYQCRYFIYKDFCRFHH